MTRASINPVVEIYPGHPSWVTTPEEPWPGLVLLSSHTPPSEVALVVHMLATYGRAQHEAARTPESLASAKRMVLPGGLMIASGALTIAPSCCCGLEQWVEWRSVLEGTGSPWLGHDPSPLVESSHEGITVWPTGGLGETRPADHEAIHFTHEWFRKAFSQAEYDLAGFLQELQSWCQASVPEYAAGITAAFRANFHVPSGPGA